MKPVLKIAGLLLVLAVAGNPARADDWIYFTVKGDTLWDLCLKYTNKRGCWIELGRYNKVANDRAMPVGTEVRIPAQWLLKQPVVGRVRAVTGEVSLQRRDGERLVPEARQLLHLGDTLVSGEGTARLELDQGGELLLRPNSQLELENLSSSESGGQASEIELLRGDVDIEIVPGRGTRFQIQTPAAVAAVRGTDFRVSSADRWGEEMRVEVLGGSVLVAGESDALLQRGQGVKVQEGEAPGELVPLLPAPDLDQAGAFVRLPSTLTWNAVPGAEEWCVDIHAADGDRDLLATRIAASPSLEMEDLGRECYLITLSAIDAEGFRGMESESQVCVGDPLNVPVGLAVRDHQQRRSGHTWSIGWQAMEEGDSYRVQLAHDAQFKDLIRTESVSENSLQLSGLANGRYYLRVAAVDAGGVQGAYSETLSLNQVDVLGAGLFAYALFLLAIF